MPTPFPAKRLVLARSLRADMEMIDDQIDDLRQFVMGFCFLRDPQRDPPA